MNRRTQKGSALVVTLAFVAIFGALAVGYIAAADANLKNAELYLNSRRAHLAAESGLAFARHVLPSLTLQSTATAADTLQSIADALNARYRNTLFGGHAAVVQGSRVVLPAVILDFPAGPARFDLTVNALSASDFTAESYGTYRQCAQSLYIAFVARTDSSLLTTFGVASRGRITMTGNTTLRGANNPLEGSVLSTSQVHLDPLYITGSVVITGDAAITNPNGSVTLKGNSNIGGDIRIGVTAPPFPAIDTAIFAPFATNVLDRSISSYTDRYFENIRIPANTNPTFSGNTVIRGVVYVESPNRVQFTGNLDLIGVVVVQPPSGPLDLANHYIKFAGGCTTNAVTALPAGAQFDGLRALDGSFLLAPGYQVEFTGNFSTINGSIAASQMKFTGTAVGTVRGSVLNYDPTDFVMSGNSVVTIDHSGLDDDPAGMIFPNRLVYVKGSYEE